MTEKRDVLITEVALRDGSHAVRHQFTVEQVTNVAKALDSANVPYIEVSHGDGLGGSSLQYGLSLVDEMKLIEAAASVVDQAKIAVLLIPGIGTMPQLKEAAQLGAKMARIATHVTEADVSQQHIATCKRARNGSRWISHDVSYGSSRKNCGTSEINGELRSRYRLCR